MKRAMLATLVVVLGLSAVVLGGCYRKELPEDQKIVLSDTWGIDLGSIDHEKVATGDTTNRTVTIPLGGAGALEASIRMGAGQLRLEAVGSDALNADFEYRPSSLKPEVSYDVASEDPAVGTLSVRQPDQSDFLFSNAKNTWDLQLAQGVPLDLDVDLGAGEGRLILGGSGLRELKMNMGAGDTTIDFSGNWDHDVSAYLQAGVGQITLRLPADVGVRVDGRRSGIGDFTADSGFQSDGDAFVNRAYGETSSTIEISVQRGIGEVRLETVR